MNYVGAPTIVIELKVTFRSMLNENKKITSKSQTTKSCLMIFYIYNYSCKSDLYFGFANCLLFSLGVLLRIFRWAWAEENLVGIAAAIGVEQQSKITAMRQLPEWSRAWSCDFCAWTRLAHWMLPLCSVRCTVVELVLWKGRSAILSRWLFPAIRWGLPTMQCTNKWTSNASWRP